MKFWRAMSNFGGRVKLLAGSGPLLSRPYRYFEFAERRDDELLALLLGAAAGGGGADYHVSKFAKWQQASHRSQCECWHSEPAFIFAFLATLELRPVGIPLLQTTGGGRGPSIEAPQGQRRLLVKVSFARRDKQILALMDSWK